MRQKIWPAALAGILLVSAACGWLYSRNSLFRLIDLSVVSDDQDLNAAVKRKLTTYLGRSLFTLSLSELDRGIREFPSVKEVSIHLRWPSGIAVRLETKKPVAMMFIDKKLCSVDSEGRRIEVLVKPVALPLLKSLPEDLDARAKLFAWLESARSFDSGALDFGAVDEISWNDDRGLLVRLYDANVDVELGFTDFDRAWSRAEQAAEVLKASGLRANFLDATYRQRVVVRLPGRLPNLANGLNSKELVRRAANRPLGGSSKEPPKAR